MRAPFRRAERKALESTRKCAEIHIRWIYHTHCMTWRAPANLIFLSKGEAANRRQQHKKWSWKMRNSIFIICQQQASSIHSLLVNNNTSEKSLFTYMTIAQAFFFPLLTATHSWPVASFAWWSKFLFSWAHSCAYIHATTGRRASELTHGEYAWIVWWSFMVGGSRCSPIEDDVVFSTPHGWNESAAGNVLF